MSLRPQPSPLVLALLFLLPAFALIFQPRVSAGEPQWLEVRSPNFSVITDAGEKRGREAAMRFEQMRAVFGTLMTQAKVKIPVPLQIVAFRNTKEMRQVAPIFRGKPTQVAGLFQGGTDRDFIMLDMSAENPWTVVFHEYAHQLMNGNLPDRTDPWFEEGFAEYFSSIEVDSKQARVGKVPDVDYRILQQVGTMRVSDLLKVEQYSETYNETGNNRTTFYVESGMLVHYIYDNQLLLKVAKYFDLKVNKHLSVEDAVQQAFGMSAPQFDKTLREYIGVGRYRYFSIPAPAHLSPDSFSAHPVSNADASAVLADIHLHSPDYQEKAISEFREILKTDPNNAAACRGLGYGFLQQQDFQQAAEYFKRASQGDSKDPRVHYYIALLMARESGFSSSVDVATLTQELESSINLDPNFADAYALLAFAQTSSGAPEKAIDTMGKALAIDPRNEEYRFNLASIYLSNRQPDQAIKILQSLRNSSNGALAARATSALASAEQFQRMQSDSSATLATRETTPAVPGDSVPSIDAPSPPPKVAASGAKSVFVRGTLTSIDCSKAPSAILTVSSGSKILKLTITDKDQMVLIGEDHFSCSWSKKKVAVNFRQGDSGENSVISLEIQ
jgi:tetratricopeptide (TPR) repeat protein